MRRMGFVMHLKDESVIPEYERLHREIDREVVKAHSRAGFRNYSIFRDGLTLFAYFESEDPLEAMRRLAQEPVMETWWALTGPLMAVDDGGKPRQTLLQETFYME